MIVLDDNGIKQYQKQLLSIVKELVAFFDMNHISYSLSGGSILGAVRHKGFIPWDDDIDLNIPRKDYNKMLQLFNGSLGNKYYLQTPQKNPEMGLMVTQIRKRGTVARRKYDIPATECGISVDIYIIENVFDDPIRFFIQKNMSMLLSFVISSIRFYNNRRLPKKIQDLEARHYRYQKAKMIAGRVLKIIPLRKWISWCDYWNSACKNEESRRVSIPTGRKHFKGEIYRREDMTRFRKASFETEQLNIPVWAKGYLKAFYGDYMTLPSPEKREKHLFLELQY